MRIAAALFAALCALAMPAAVAQPPRPVALTFENSGAPAAQEPFLRGLALLHNFEYPRAAEAFRQAQAADPGFALAYWGEAMTYNHPIWMEQDAAAGRAVLARFGPTREARLARVLMERERSLLEAVEILYGEGSKEDRDRAYSSHMGDLLLGYPDDVDIQSFYALSLLGLAHQGRDVRLYMRAAGQLEALLPRHPNHPGVLHYLIHSYDDPTHAPLGLRAAYRYGDVAPDAPHARHMTSHIFLALGMWGETIEANRAADAEVDRLRAASGQPPTSCGHYNEWLVYALYQSERSEEASTVASACWNQVRAQLAAPASATGRAPPAVSWADMTIRGVIEDRELPDNGYAEALGQAHPQARFTLAYAELIARLAELGPVRAARARLIEIDRELAEAARTSPEPAYAPRRRAIVLAQAEALEALRSGRTEEGLAILRRAAETERSMPAEFGPPLVEKPSFELLGEELGSLHRRSEAEAAFRAALELAPNRRRPLLGLDAMPDRPVHPTRP